VACEALEVVARCAHLSDRAAAAAAFRRAADLAEEHGLAPWRIRALLGLGTTELNDDETGTLERVRALALDAGMLAQVADVDLLLGDAAASVAGPVAALPLVERSVALARRVRLEQTAAMALAGCAEGYLLAGRMDDMRAALREAGERAAGERVAADAAAAGTAVLAMQALLDRDLPGACRLYDQAAATAAGHGSAAPLRFLGLRVLLRTVLDDRAAAARDELEAGPGGRRAVNRGALLYAEAVAAGRAGQSERAVALRAAGDRLLARQHYWRLLLRLLVHEAALADGWGDPVGQLRHDLPGHDRYGPTPLARTCRDLLRRAGAPVPRRGRGDSQVPAALRAAGVTSREMDVLGLVAQGLTNAQIAERLFLSPRTVETHVANLLAKTGATGRAELAEHVGRSS
jgi:DNA-binding CsgD family transcriptional regulator